MIDSIAGWLCACPVAVLVIGVTVAVLRVIAWFRRPRVRYYR